MKYRTTLFLASMLLATTTSGFLPTTTRAAEMPGDFSTVREIEIEGDNSTDRMPAVGFDASVYLSARDDFPDLRIFDDRDRAVPYLIEKTMTGNQPATESFDIPKTKLETTINQDMQATEIIFDTGRRPVTELVIATPDRNFTRRVQLYRSPPIGYNGPLGSWLRITEGEISNVSFGELDEKNLQLRFGETRADRLKLVIENGDNPPLEISGLQLTGPTHHALFLAEAGRKYRMAYGSSALDRPNYDTTAITRIRRAGMESTPATLGAIDESAQPSLPPTEPALRRWLRDRRVVIGIIAVMVVLLAFALYGAVVRAKKEESE